MRDIYPTPDRTVLRTQPARAARTALRARVISDVIIVGSEPVPKTLPKKSSSQPTTAKEILPRARGASIPPLQKEALHSLPEKVPNPDVTPKNPRRSWWRTLLTRRRAILSGALVAILLTVTGYVTFDTWRTNSQVRAELHAQGVAATITDTTEGRRVAEGRDESLLPSNALDEYKVAADQPRILRIDAINVAARVLPMGVNPDGSMQAPLNIFDAGWYMGSAKPGAEGAMVIDAHASGPTRQGLFAYLDTLKEGDVLRLERGDSERFTYKVRHIETVALGDVDMEKLLLPYEGVKEGMNLITCAGKWADVQKTFDHRVTVYTERVKG